MLRDTLRALALPRRALPLAMVMAPALYLQWRYSTSMLALPIGVLLCLAFVVIAPATWRYLFPVDDEPTKDALFRLGLYGLLGAGVVSGFGSTLPRVLNMPPTFLTHRPSLIVCIALFLVGGWGLGRDIDFEKRLLRERERAKTLAEDAERARLLAVANHLDPHFLFNTLNAIAEWCREDGKVAEAAVLRLSALLRSIMDGIATHPAAEPSSQSWSFAREIELVRGLWELHQLRDPGAFRVHIELPDALAEREVPPLLLLGLAENAVKHGPAAGHRGLLSLHVRELDTSLVVTVENPGVYAGPRPGGHGIELTERRARAHFGADAEVLFENLLTEEAPRTRARVSLPNPRPAT